MVAEKIQNRQEREVAEAVKGLRRSGEITLLARLIAEPESEREIDNFRWILGGGTIINLDSLPPSHLIEQQEAAERELNFRVGSTLR